jgi:integrase
MKREKQNLPITETNLPKIEHRAAGIGDYFNWDPKLKGFGLRIRNGNRTWIFQYRYDGDHRIRLGGSELSCNQARELARAESGKLSKARLGHGLDPAAEREQRKAEAKPRPKAANAFASLIPTYLEARRGGLKDSTHEIQERHLNIHWTPLHDLPLDGITRADVAAILNAIAKDRGPIAANRARATLSKFFRWAIGEGLCDNNPVGGTNKRDENDPRERSLSDAEVAQVWLAAPDNDYGRILKLILLTGCRRAEVGDLKWSEIDLEARTIKLPRERTKNHQEHIVPLSDAAMSVLAGIKHRDRDYIFGRLPRAGFSGWSHSKEELDETLKLKEPWTVHDLRRTVRTGLGQLGIAPHIAEATLNHLPAKLIRTYDRNKYESEKRAALDQWATHLKTVVAQATGANVTPLRKGDSAGGKKR